MENKHSFFRPMFVFCFFFLPDISSFPVPPPTSAAAADAVGAIYFATTATFNNRERAGNFNKKKI